MSSILAKYFPYIILYAFVPSSSSHYEVSLEACHALSLLASTPYKYCLLLQIISKLYRDGMRLLTVLEVFMEKLSEFLAADNSLHHYVVVMIESIKVCHRLVGLLHQPTNMLIQWEFQVFQ